MRLTGVDAQCRHTSLLLPLRIPPERIEPEGFFPKLCRASSACVLWDAAAGIGLIATVLHPTFHLSVSCGCVGCLGGAGPKNVCLRIGIMYKACVHHIIAGVDLMNHMRLALD